jgi:hypothetical protein
MVRESRILRERPPRNRIEGSRMGMTACLYIAKTQPRLLPMGMDGWDSARFARKGAVFRRDFWHESVRMEQVWGYQHHKW